MEISEQAFRRAAVGGFNRQDVLNYIEEAASAATAHAEDLEKENAALRAQRAELETASQTAVERAQRAEQQLDEVTAQLEEKRGALIQTGELLERERTEGQHLREELDKLKEKTARMESGAAAYAELRDRTGTIELEAHQRAILIEQIAEERAREIQAAGEESARKLQTEAERLICQVQAGYALLRESLDSAASAAALEYDRMGQTLAEVKSELTAHDAVFGQLLEACRQRPEQGLTPLPLTGEE